MCLALVVCIDAEQFVRPTRPALRVLIQPTGFTRANTPPLVIGATPGASMQLRGTMQLVVRFREIDVTTRGGVLDEEGRDP